MCVARIPELLFASAQASAALQSKPDLGELNRARADPCLRESAGRRAALLVFAVLLFEAFGFALDASAPAWHVLDTYQQPQGLPQNSVYAILQTSDGFLWVGTKGGLARFDGVGFTVFSARAPNQLRASEVQALAEGNDGSLWIATHGGGISRYKDGRFTTYTQQQGLISDYLMAICRDPEGDIWVGGSAGVSHFQSGSFTNYTVNEGLADNNTLALLCDSDGSVWMGARSGELRRFKGQQIVHESLNVGSPIRVLYRDRRRALWIGTNDGLFRFDPGGLTHYTVKQGLSSNLVRRLYEDSQGNLWIGSQDGLNRYRDGTITSSGLPRAISQTNITGIAGDQEGNLWVGTHYQGLVRLHQGEFLSYTKENGLTNDDIQTLVGDASGTIWIGTATGLNAFREGKFIAFTEKSGLPEKRTDPHIEDRRGHLWVGVEDWGLYRSRSPATCQRSPCRLASLTFKNIIPRVRTAAALEDRSGGVWIATDGDGLMRFPNEDATAYTTYTVRDGLPTNQIKDLVQGQAGEVWIATSLGLARYSDGKFRVYSQKDGLGDSFIEQLLMDGQGVLWIATNHGLSELTNNRFSNYSFKDGLPCENITHMIEDDRRNLWISCNLGIFRIAKQQFSDFAAGKLAAISAVAYGLEHGLSSTVPAAGSQPAVYKDPEGRVWFAMIKGICVADPARLSTNSLPPPVHIEEVAIDQHSYPAGHAAEVPPGRGDLEFHYAGLSFLAPERVRFQYQLEGYDRGWIAAGDRRAAYYGKIPPGTYTFHVVAANNDGVWNQKGDSFSFRLKPHFYQTVWFDALCVLFAGIFLWRVIRFNERRLLRRELELSMMQDSLSRRIAAEARYRDLFESAVYGIYRSRGGSYLEVNQAMVAMLGYDSKQQVLALDPGTEVYANQSDLLKLQTALEAAEPVEGIEATWKRKDGRPITVLLSGRRIADPRGPEDTCEIFVKDITEHKQLEGRLRQAQKMDAIGRLAGGIAHDFNNLLTIILGYTRLLLDREISQERQSDALHQVERAADQAAGLTSQLLAFSRQQVVQPGVHNLNSIVANSKCMLERVIGEDIHFAANLAPDISLIKADRSQLEQVILNLAVNARDAMAQGGKLSFTTRNAKIRSDTNNRGRHIPAGDYVVLEVSDTGTGMDGKTLEHVFDPFFTTKDIGRGTGLGLSTVYGIVKQNGGHIEVESTVGKGTTFRIYLPQTLEPESAPVGEQKPTRELQGSETVLLVEDDRPLRELTGTILRNNGYNVFEAAGAAEAERMVREYSGTIHLILADVVMPEVSGPLLGKALQKLRPGARLLYTSGYTEDHRLRQEVFDRRLPFLQKPYGRVELLTKVREVLDKPENEVVVKTGAAS